MRVELRDSLDFLYSDSKVNPKPATRLSLDVARGSAISVNILLNEINPNSKIAVRVIDGKNVVSLAELYNLIAVPVEENTGLKNFTESTGGPNPFVVRRAPFNVFDAMQPIQSPVSAISKTMAIRIRIPVPEKSKPGKKKYIINIENGDKSESLTLDVIIHKAVIPAVGSKTWPYTNWFSYELIASRHGLKLFSEPYWKMLEKYAALMARSRQNTFWIPLPVIFEKTADGLKLNRPRLRRIISIFTKAGMNYIEGGHIANRSTKEWESPTFSVAMDGPVTSTPEGNALICSSASQLMEEIERNGWSSRWIQHATDEPIDKNAMEYRILTGIVRKYMPGIPILDATMDTKLAGSVDIWCPQCHEAQKHIAEFDKLKKLGDKVWFYTCCSPGGPWLNRLLDQELLRPALLGWGGAQFGLDGFLHWGLNHYRDEQDPFKMSVVSHGGNMKLPAGDTHVVYPGKNEPWPSVRLESQREGIEDFELLLKLKKKNPRAAKKIINSVIRGFDDYTKDVREFRKARKALLKEVSK